MAEHAALTRQSTWSVPQIAVATAPARAGAILASLIVSVRLHCMSATAMPR